MVHPAGDRLAYVLRRVHPQASENRYRSEIRLIDLRTRRERTLTASEMDSEAPLWSPQGDRLLLLSRRSGDELKQLYLLPADGGEARRLTQLKGGVRQAEWSPDGRHIAFLGVVDPRDDKKGADGRGVPFSDDVQVLDSAHWHLNGLGSWVHKRFHLHLVRAAGGRPRQLTRGAWSVGGAFLHDSSFCFSRDGRLLYYLASPDPGDDWAAVRRVDLFELDLESGQSRRVTRFPGMLLAVRPGENGELVVIGNDLKLGTASNNRLWKVRSRSGRMQPIDLGLDLSIVDAVNSDVRFLSRDFDPWISLEGDRARVRITERGAVRLAEVDLKRGGARWLSPQDCSVLGWHGAPDGSAWAEVRTSVTELPELWIGRPGEPAERITGHNDRLLATRKAIPARPLHFKASDGARVDGWGLIPPGRPKGGRPAVLAIHGGPKTVYGASFMLEFQMLAGAGMAVLYSNPRGSDGYGEAWAHAVYGRYGERDYQDLMEFVDRGLRAGLGLSRRRLGVSGGSYGGFMTNWIVGHTDRFKAAVSQRGISNWVSMFGTSDIGYFFNPDHVGGLPWENPEQYVEKSPLTYAANVHTPLLLTHGEQDLRCPIEQAEQFFIFLKRLGRTVKLARFPEETHELSRSGSPNRRMERLRLILEWFQEWL
jgi:dipeptidyl aminopeptidase/acylaminoacyl peptidase